MGAKASVLATDVLPGATPLLPQGAAPVAEPGDMSKSPSRGFTLIEVMIVVAIIGLLAAIAIPLFVRHMKVAKQNDAVLALNRLSKNAKVYYTSHVAFPQGTAGVLPGPDGDACKTGRLAVTNAWVSDPVWTELDFDIVDPSLFSYHYTSSTANTAEAIAVADLDCDKTLSTYKLELSGATGTPAAELIIPTDPD